MRRHGGRLFLWQRTTGRAFVRDYMSLDRGPAEFAFDCHHHAKRGVYVCLAPGLDAREVIVRARKWPFRGVRVYVNGKRWGWGGQPGL